MIEKIVPLTSYNRTIITPPDKSITHRGIMFSALCHSNVKVHNALLGADCISTMECAKAMGASVSLDGNTVSIKGVDPSSASLDVGNSGTTMRLMSGLLAGQIGKKFTLDGDDSIRKRPMDRIITPLCQMGAEIFGKDNKSPLTIIGKPLNAIDYQSPIASAQVKSAILLAGLKADGITSVTEPIRSRDHTERMLSYFGAKIDVNDTKVSVQAGEIKPQDINVVGDISSATYPLVLTASIKGGRVVVKNVGLNKTRDGLLRVLDMCGATFAITNITSDLEPCGDIELRYTKLKPFTITGELVPLLVDEIPALAVLACSIEGESRICGAGELKVKESNRIDTIVNNLKKLGADIEATDDGMIIRGGKQLQGGATIDPSHDHRIAMSMAIAGAISKDGAIIKNAECASVSYPNFYSIVKE